MGPTPEEEKIKSPQLREMAQRWREAGLLKDKEFHKYVLKTFQAKRNRNFKARRIRNLKSKGGRRTFSSENMKVPGFQKNYIDRYASKYKHVPKKRI